MKQLSARPMTLIFSALLLIPSLAAAQPYGKLSLEIAKNAVKNNGEKGAVRAASKGTVNYLVPTGMIPVTNEFTNGVLSNAQSAALEKSVQQAAEKTLNNPLKYAPFKFIPSTNYRVIRESALFKPVLENPAGNFYDLISSIAHFNNGDPNFFALKYDTNGKSLRRNVTSHYVRTARFIRHLTALSEAQGYGALFYYLKNNGGLVPALDVEEDFIAHYASDVKMEAFAQEQIIEILQNLDAKNTPFLSMKPTDWATFNIFVTFLPSNLTSTVLGFMSDGHYKAAIYLLQHPLMKDAVSVNLLRWKTSQGKAGLHPDNVRLPGKKQRIQSYYARIEKLQGYQDRIDALNMELTAQGRDVKTLLQKMSDNQKALHKLLQQNFAAMNPKQKIAAQHLRATLEGNIKTAKKDIAQTEASLRAIRTEANPLTRDGETIRQTINRLKMRISVISRKPIPIVPQPSAAENFFDKVSGWFNKK